MHRTADAFKLRCWDTRKNEWLDGDGNDVFGTTSMEECGFYTGILEQYTGFKDEDGKEIYEGDIIDLFGIYLEVVWSQDEAKFDLTNNDFRVGAFIFDKYTVSHIRVVGNIHENSELLERKYRYE